MASTMFKVSAVVFIVDRLPHARRTGVQVMAQVYSDPKRASDPYALPDVEVFFHPNHDKHDPTLEPGWYYWFCFPGCLPDSEPMGPFATQDEAVKAAQEESNNDDE